MGKKPANTDVRFWRDPDLPGVEARFSSYNREAFRDHTHAAYSIGILESGRTTFTLEGSPYSASAGEMVFIGPDVAHACNPDPESDMTYRMFYVDAPRVESVAAEVFDDTPGTVFFPAPVVSDPDLPPLWRALYDAVTTDADRLEKETLLFQALAETIARHAEPEPLPRQTDNDRAVRAVKEHLAANLSRKVSLDDLSRVAHVSRYHLLRVFQAATGLPPHAYQNQLRVDLGKRLLAAGMSISRAATEAGFADQSHFSRVFKQYTGATPRQYQAS